ncbi:EF-hand domain-containing protein 1-like [Stegodyphus dumicola]|uniref:EF-hand domain-containing protein 1-like n=1 Tax=Stegodyphus dumicola TaxID=202533 RepID=UPI0015B27909|nr:EF-hand domain-containing protein 1-like [Stegodyphus dumicola]
MSEYPFNKMLLLGFRGDQKRAKNPQTLVYNKGVSVAKDICPPPTTKEAWDLLDAQNKALISKDRLIELTYGPKKPHVKNFLPRYAELDRKVLCFDAVKREDTPDYPGEKNRVHFVKLYYYLENDTLRVLEPEVSNSGLYQGTLHRRDRYLHPNTKRYYNWKDLNVGNDIIIFGITYHLYDCDHWTRVYLTNEGIEVNEAELKPEDPLQQQKKHLDPRKELRNVDLEVKFPLRKFYKNSDKVLKFYGIWKNELEDPIAIRRIVLYYYLDEDKIEITENILPNSGRPPFLPFGREGLDNIPTNSGRGSFMTVLGKQKVLLDRKKEVDKIPCYLEPLEDDDLTCIGPGHLKMQEDIDILGRKIFLTSCDEFTHTFYREHYGIDMPQVEVLEKPKAKTPVLIPTHQYGPWEEGFLDCLDPVSIPKRIHHSMQPKSEEIMKTVLRFSACMDTPRKTEQSRRFIISYFLEDDTVKIHEENISNSGFGSGTFLNRCRLRKDLGPTLETTPSIHKGKNPVYYEASDFYIGAKIKASGSTFLILDADLVVFKFMERHPEIYKDICVKEQQKLANILNGKSEISHSQRMHLLDDLREDVLKNYGPSSYPIPESLDLRLDFCSRELAEQRIYSANLPINRALINKLLDTFTFKEKTDLREVRTFLLVALGHDREH